LVHSISTAQGLISRGFSLNTLSVLTVATGGVNFSAELSRLVPCVHQCRMLQYPETQVEMVSMIEASEVHFGNAQVQVF
jgi:hypothetical protein